VLNHLSEIVFAGPRAGFALRSSQRKISSCWKPVPTVSKSAAGCTPWACGPWFWRAATSASTPRAMPTMTKWPPHASRWSICPAMPLACDCPTRGAASAASCSTPMAKRSPTTLRPPTRYGPTSTATPSAPLGATSPWRAPVNRSSNNGTGRPSKKRSSPSTSAIWMPLKSVASVSSDSSPRRSAASP
jgi:hypothetical protein